ncbi:hypothetical protein B0H13DRAFT_2318907 [Mycena leptocephala]|nr:hypothetical protein B0H13DRAFT_2318907 [Mycena leptocephala]
MACSDHVDPLHKEFSDASAGVGLDERDWSELSAPRVGDDLSLVLSRIQRVQRLPRHLSTFVDAYSAIIEPFISSTSPTSAPIWGPIVFALQTVGCSFPLIHRPALTDLALQAMLEVFDDISDHLSRLVVSNRQFFGDKAVKRALSFIYGDVIKICLQIIVTIPRDSGTKRLSRLLRGLGQLLLAVPRWIISIIMARKQIPKNLCFNSEVVVVEPGLKTLQNEFHRHAQFVADYVDAITRGAMLDSLQHLSSNTKSSSSGQAGFNIDAIPPDVILEIFSIAYPRLLPACAVPTGPPSAVDKAAV